MIDLLKKSSYTPNLRFRKRLITLLGLVLLTGFAMAQKTTIKGKITDSENGDPIPGVNIVVEGTTVGAISDVNGNYTISVPSADGTLLFSYVGYLPQKVALSGRSEIAVSLAPDVKTIDEVVVIGYGSVSRKDLTGAVTSLGGKALRNIPVSNMTEALTGRLAGVQVTTTDGSPDAEMIVRVRGGGSVTGSNTPLYIVDGFPVSSLSVVPPSDIENVSILKDASSTAIYGSQGANGVVLITTKTAKGGKTTVSFNSLFQFKQLSKNLDVMSPYEYVLYNYEYAALRGTTSTDYSSFVNKFGVYDDLDLYKYQKGRDYQDEFFGSKQTSYIHNLSISGGSEKTRYTLSANYNKDYGLIKSNNFGRLNLNFKLSHEILKNLKADFNVRVTNSKVSGSGTSGDSYKIRTYQAITRGPVDGFDDIVPVDVSSMTEEEYEDYLASTMTLTEQAEQYWKKNNTNTYYLTTAFNWQIIKGLILRSELGYESNYNQVKNYWGATTSVSANDGSNLPLVDWTKTESAKYRIANTLTYMFTPIEKNNINIMVGQELLSTSKSYNYIKAKYFSKAMTPEKIFANIGLSSGISSSSFEYPDDRLESFFGRLLYSLNEKYLFTALIRTDGSNKFAKNNRWGYFPAASAAWRISQEPFMKNLTFLTELKWRVLSFGVSGNNNIGSTQYQLDYKATNTGSNTTGKPYGVGEVVNSYYVATNTQLANPDIKWESTITRNSGIDFALFNNQINGTLDAYWNTTKDLLLYSTIVAPGYTSKVENIGQTSSKGIEFSLSGVIIKKTDFNLSANFNIAFNRSNVDKLANGISSQTYNSAWAGTDMKGSDDYRVIVGHPIGLMYGFITEGYYTTDDFDPTLSVDGTYVLKAGVATPGSMLGGTIGVRPGTLKLKDLNGDGSIDTNNDRDIIGNPNPKHTGGFSISGNYKNIDFQVMFSWVYGNDVYNATKIASTQNYRSTFPNLLNTMNSSKRYTYLNTAGEVVTDLATLKEMNEVGANKKTMWSPHSFGSAVVIPHSWAIEDGSFLRLQNITMGYTMPKKWMDKLAVSSFRLYCTVSNIWVWTNYSGYDPEVSSTIRNSTHNQLTPGVDFSSFPKSLSFTFGANLNF